MTPSQARRPRPAAPGRRCRAAPRGASAAAAAPARRGTGRRRRAPCCARGRRSACRGRSRPSTWSARPATREQQRPRSAAAVEARSRPAGRAATSDGLVEDGAHGDRGAAPLARAAARIGCGPARLPRPMARRPSPARAVAAPSTVVRQRHVRSRAACRSARSTGPAGSRRCRPRSGTGRRARSRRRGARSAPPRRRRSRRSRPPARRAIARRVERRERGVERVVAMALVDLAGVVLLVGLDLDDLRRAGLAARLVRRARRRRCADGAFLRHAVQRAGG